MGENALSVANRFVDLAKERGENITQLGLMERVYIAHGFSLAIYDESLLDSRFDRVEAWKYGPVIPSVYHSFKHWKDQPITERAVIMKWENNKPVYEYPTVRSPHAESIIEMVYERYHGMSDGEMVDLTHREGTPWYWYYKEGENVEIKDTVTKAFYRKIVDSTMGRTGYGG